MDDDRKRLILAELVKELSQPEIPDGAVTVRMLVKESGKAENTCRKLLERRVRDGTMAFVTVIQTKYYYLVE